MQMASALPALSWMGPAVAGCGCCHQQRRRTPRRSRQQRLQTRRGSQWRTHSTMCFRPGARKRGCSRVSRRWCEAACQASHQWLHNKRKCDDIPMTVVGRPIVTNVMAGFNSCVLAYGATSSGEPALLGPHIRDQSMLEGMRCHSISMNQAASC